MNLKLLYEFTKRDFTERYSGSLLGVSWAFIWPLVNLLIYIIIFSKLFGARLPGVSAPYSYAIYLIAGMVPWTAFSNTVLRSATIFSDKKYIISKMRINLPIFPFYIILSESLVFLISYSFFIIFLLITGKSLVIWVVFVPLILIAQQIFAYALGFITAIFYVFLRDLREIISIILQVWFWFTPIVYVFDILPAQLQALFAYNPAYLFINAYQNIFVFNQAPNFLNLMKLVAIGHILLLITYFCYKKLEKDIRDFL